MKKFTKSFSQTIMAFLMVAILFIGAIPAVAMTATYQLEPSDDYIYDYIKEGHTKEEEFGLDNEDVITASIMPFSTPIDVFTWEDLTSSIADPSNAGQHLVFSLMNNITANSEGGINIRNRIVSIEGNGFSIFNHVTGYAHRHFDVRDGSVLHLHNVNITRDLPAGNTSVTGGIRIRDNSVVHMHDGAIVSNNRGAQGGAFAIGGNATLYMHHGSIIRDNVATGAGGGVRIWRDTETASPRMIINGGVIENNMAGAAGGGGIWIGIDAPHQASAGEGAIVTLHDGAIRNNGGRGVLVSFPQQQFNILGGYIHDNTGGIQANSGGRVVMSGGEIHDNDVSGNGGGASVQTGASFTMTGGTIQNNTALLAGGGVYVGSGGYLYMHNDSVIDNNRASGSGGGVRATDGSTFNMYAGAMVSNNYSESLGGGISLLGATFTMMGGQIYRNVSENSGGGIHANTNSNVYINGGRIHHNRSIHPTGGGGGGIALDAYATDSTALTITGGYIDNNIALGGVGGGIHIWQNSTVTMSGGYIYENEARTRGGGVDIGLASSNFIMTGGTITANRTNNGGGVYIAGGGTMTMVDGEISHHTQRATENVGNVRPWGITNGAGVFVENGTFDLEGGVISHNIAQNGSGVRVNPTSVMTMTGGYIEHNGYRGRVAHPTLPNNQILGGGVYVGAGQTADQATFIMDGGVIQYNTATNGAGVLLGESTNPAHPIHAVMLMYGGYIRNNDNFYHTGGGIDVRPSGSLTMFGGEISGNRAVHGGGILLNGTTFDFHGGDIINNRAYVHPYERVLGGGLYAGGAGGSGGGIQAGWWQGADGTQSSAINMQGEDALISGNWAEAYGGGIYLAGNNSELHAVAGSITNNHAENDGGGIFTDNHHYSRTLPTGAYGNLNIHSTVVFAGNTAGNGAYLPPINYYITNVAEPAVGNGPSVGVPGLDEDPALRHTLNNYDINFRFERPAVSIEKTTDDFVVAGEDLTYTITVTNTGNVDLVGIAVQDVLPVALTNPRDLTITPADAGTASFISTTPRTLNVTIPNLAVGEYVEITFTVTVDENLEAGYEIINNASVDVLQMQGVGGQTSATTTVIEPELTVVKTAPATVTQGGNITYTITVQNTGNIDLEGVVVIDTLPAGLSNPRNVVVLSAAAGEGAFDGNVLTVNIGELAVDELVTITFVATATNAANMQITNTATATGTTSGGVETSGSGSSTTTTTQGGGNGYDPDPVAGVSITKTAPQTVAPNGYITYTITVRNTGDLPLTNVTVMDTLPSTLTNPRSLNITGGGASAEGSFIGQVLTVNIPRLEVGQTVTITFVATATGVADTTITNHATVDTSETGRQTSTTSTRVTSEQQALIKVPDKMTVYVGDTINWTLRGFHNRSGSDATNFSIMDIPGGGLNFAAGSLPAFAGGAGVTFEIRYTIAGSDAVHIHSTGNDASQPLTFNLPQSGDLHYTSIEFYFGDVPAYFGLNNEIVLTFVVGSDTPSSQLVNNFVVSYNGTPNQGLSPYRPVVTTPSTSGGGGGGWTGGGTTPNQTPDTQQPPVVTPPTVQQPEQAEQDPAQPAGESQGDVGVAPEATPEAESQRENPQTGDNASYIVVALAVAGLITSLGVLLLVAKSSKRKANNLMK